MRKGTRSCLQCRYSKIACSFQALPGAVCRQCSRRGVRCTRQEYDIVHLGDKDSQGDGQSLPSQSGDDQESLMRRVFDRFPRPQADQQRDALAMAQMLACLEPYFTLPSDEAMPGITNQAPIVSLFDNSVLNQQEPLSRVPPFQHRKRTAILNALRAIAPPEAMIDHITKDEYGIWRHIWGALCPYTEDAPEQFRNPLQQITVSDDPVVVAKAILYVALNLCHLPSSFEFSQWGLTGDRVSAMESYVNIVDRLVTSDDELVSSIDGLECIALSIKYYLDLGRMRKACLLARRALGIAQQCGLVNFTSLEKFKHPLEKRRVAKLWAYFLIADMHQALLLGLAHSASDQMITSFRLAAESVPGFMDGELFQARMFPIIKKLVERNQEYAPPSLEATLELDRQLETLGRERPEDWWRVRTAAEAGISLDEHVSRRTRQFLFQEVRAVLHMPFMLRPASSQKYSYSYHTALESSRRIIIVFDSIRSESHVSLVLSRIYDFFAFQAAVTLLINLVGGSQSQHSGQTAANEETMAQRLEDSRLVDKCIALLKMAADAGPTGRVPAQCARALELLVMAARSPLNDGSALCVSIPYFGRIRVGPVKNIPGTSQAQQSPANDSFHPSEMFPTGTSQPGSTVGATSMPTPESSSSEIPGTETAWMSGAPSFLQPNGPMTGHMEDMHVGLDTMGSFAGTAPPVSADQSWTSSTSGYDFDAAAAPPQYMDRFMALGADWALDLEQTLGWGHIGSASSRPPYM